MLKVISGIVGAFLIFILIFTFSGFGVNDEEVIKQYNLSVYNGVSTTNGYVTPEDYAETVEMTYDHTDIRTKGKDGKETFNLLWTYTKEQYFYISSPYREIRGEDIHWGTDIAADLGTPIRAVCDGQVSSFMSANSGFGSHTPVIKAADGSFSVVYGHCGKCDLKVGDKVKAGDIVAYTGKEGIGTGSHLHLEYFLEDSTSHLYGAEGNLDENGKVTSYHYRNTFDALGDSCNYDLDKSYILSRKKRQ